MIGFAGLTAVAILSRKDFSFLGGMLLFSTYLTMLVWPMMAIGWVLTMVQRGAAGIDRKYLRKLLKRHGLYG